MNQHIFLTALGKGKADTKYPYRINDTVYQAHLAPLATIKYLTQQLHPDPIDSILVLVTKVALNSSWPVFEREANEFSLEKIDIPDGKDESEISEILEKVAIRFPKGSSITLDVTQGFRHFPFILYALALYLRSLKDIEIKGAYYGKLEVSDYESPRPILNLQPLLELPEWFYAIRMFRETGSARAMQQMIDKHSKKIHQDARLKNDDQDIHKKASPFDKLKKPFEEITYAYESGMPIEIGEISTTLQLVLNDEFVELLKKHVPLADDLNEAIQRDIGRFGSNSPTCLDKNELERQANLIDLYLERSQMPLALGLMREWVVSWVVFHTGDHSNWLKRDERIKAERQLGLLKSLSQEKYDDAKIKTWGDFWSQLSELRNSLHHHGMREQRMKFPPSQLDRIRESFERLRNNEIEFPRFGGGKGRLLITPQGLSPGVLYSAVKQTNPDYCLVICSSQSEPYIQEAISHAEFQEKNVQCFVMNNPNQYDEKEIIRILENHKKMLIDADEVVGNLTGGTTIMGVIVQRVIEKAQRYNRPTRRCILIDSRVPKEQRNDPYKLSEITWLDKEEGDNDADD